MKNIIVTLLFALALLASAADWQQINPANISADLHDVTYNAFSGRLVAVGNDATIIYSDNQGESWEKASSNLVNPSGLVLSSITFSSAYSGYAVGSSGLILKTNDGGRNWQQQISPAGTYGLNAVAFKNDNFGVAVGSSGIILRSENGGLNWERVENGFNEQNFQSVTFTSNEWFAAGMIKDRYIYGHPDYSESFLNGVILKSSQTALSWTEIQTEAKDPYHSIVSINDSVLLVASGYIEENPCTHFASGKLKKINTSGYVLSETSEQFSRYSKIKKIDNSSIYAFKDFYHIEVNPVGTISEYRSIVKSQDNGTGWNKFADSVSLYSMTPLIQDKLCGIGKLGSVSIFNGTNQHSNFFWLNSISKIKNGQQKFVIADPEVYRSSENSFNWTPITLPIISEIHDLLYFSPDTLLFSGRSYWGWDTTDRIYKSINNGANWEEVNYNSTGIFFHHLYFFNSQNGFFLENTDPLSEVNRSIYHEKAYRTTDGGTTISEVSFPQPVAEISVENRSTGYLCGQNGLIMKTTDAGANWSTLASPTTKGISKILFNGLHGVINADSTDIYTTTDGGLNWNLLSAKKRVKEWHFADNKLYLLDFYGNLSSSSDLGLNWQSEVSDSRLKSFVIDGKLGLAGGNNGLLLRTNELSVSGEITQNTIWQEDTVRVTGNVTVEQGAELQIKSGTKVIFTGNYDIKVYGQIKAIGTADRKIEFTTAGNSLWNGFYYPENLDNDSSVFEYCVFRKAATDQSGSFTNGGVFEVKKGNKIVVADCEAEENDAKGNGGFLAAEKSEISIINSLFYHNKAALSGGVIFADSSALNITNSTFVANQANTGGAVSWQSSNGLVQNSICYFNQAEIGREIFLADNDSDPDFYYNDISGGKEFFDGAGSGSSFSGIYLGNFDSDPLFDINDTHYALNISSPCVNSGSLANNIEVRLLDLSGNPRIYAEAIDLGARENSTTGIADPGIINSYELFQNYPNPFNPETTIAFNLPDFHLGSAELKIYNTNGQMVKNLNFSNAKPGRQSIKINLNNLTSGIYFYTLQAKNFQAVKRMVLIK